MIYNVFSGTYCTVTSNNTTQATQRTLITHATIHTCQSVPTPLEVLVFKSGTCTKCRTYSYERDCHHFWDVQRKATQVEMPFCKFLPLLIEVRSWGPLGLSPQPVKSTEIGQSLLFLDRWPDVRGGHIAVCRDTWNDSSRQPAGQT